MRITALILSALIMSLTVSSQVHVKGYYRANGTYVQPHVRSNPDGNPYNNWSYPGNTNPYTGKTATGNPETYLKNYYNNNSSSNSGDVWVNGYYRNDGTYVQGHWRSKSNGNPYDNWSYPGNTNPYTDKTSSGNEDTYLKNYNDNSSSTNNHGIGYVKSNTLNLRSGPSTNYSILKTLPFGESVEVISNDNPNWTKVKVSYFDGYIMRSLIGYVYSSYISESNPLFDTPSYPDYNYNNVSSSYNSNSSTYYPYGFNKGKITLWTDCSDDGQISVYINDEYKGLITKYFHDSYSPDCGDSGTLEVILPADTYKITATGNKNKWEGYVTVTADKCKIQKLAK